VQFHPESILSLREDLGVRLIANVVAHAHAPTAAASAIRAGAP
jgi:hypothetical protein